MIRNGRPYSNENGYDDRYLMDDMPREERTEVLAWIRDNIRPRKTPNHRHSSYGMKHILESDTGIYLTNNQFKDAMMLCGYMPLDADELNWCYRISQRSAAFDRKRRANR